MSAALITTVSDVQQAASALTNTVTVGTALPAGTLVVVVGNRSTTTGACGGTVTDSKSNTYTQDATSQRASTHDINIWSSVITTALTAADTVTLSWDGSASNRRVLVLRAFSGAGARLAASNQTEAANVTASAGANGSSTSASATTTGSAAGLVVGVGSLSGTITGTGPDNNVFSAKTSAGTSDRGVCTQWREDGANAAQTSTVTLSATGGWAAAVAVYTVTAPAAQPMEVVVGGAKKTVVNKSVVVGGAKKTVVNASVIIGGVKKTLV